MSDLPPNDEEKGATALLLRAHAAASPSAEDRARVRARLSSALALGAAGTVGAVATKKGIGALAGLSSLPLAAKIGLSVFVVGVATTATVMKLEDTAAPPRGIPSASAPVHTTPTQNNSSAAPTVAAPTRAEPIPAFSSAPLAPPAPPAPAQSAAAATPPVLPTKATTTTAADLPNAPSDSGAVAVASAPARDPNEVTLLGRMTQSLGRGDAATALTLAAEHERTYPKSVFTEEREGARTVARCMTVSDGTARQATGDAFLARYPHSPMRARVLATCNSKNETP